MKGKITVEPLTADAFTEFGDVIETNSRHYRTINEGLAKRYFNLAQIDLAAGQPYCSIVETKGRDLNQPLSLMERHVRSTQAFVPMNADTFIVVVSKSEPTPDSLRAFVTNGRQGINYRRGIWHHALIAPADARFLVVDAGGPDLETDELNITGWHATLQWEDERPEH